MGRTPGDVNGRVPKRYRMDLGHKKTPAAMRRYHCLLFHKSLRPREDKHEALAADFLVWDGPRFVGIRLPWHLWPSAVSGSIAGCFLLVVSRLFSKRLRTQRTGARVPLDAL